MGHIVSDIDGSASVSMRLPNTIVRAEKAAQSRTDIGNIDIRDADIRVLPIAARIPLVILFLVVGVEPSWVIGLLGSVRRYVSMLLQPLFNIGKVVGSLSMTACFRDGIVGLLLAALSTGAIVMHLQMPPDFMTSLGLAGSILLLAAYCASSLAVHRIRLQAIAIRSQSNRAHRVTPR